VKEINKKKLGSDQEEETLNGALVLAEQAGSKGGRIEGKQGAAEITKEAILLPFGARHSCCACCNNVFRFNSTSLSRTSVSKLGFVQLSYRL